MKNLVLSSIFIIAFSGCAPSVFRELRREGAENARETDVAPWFTGERDHYLYNSGIDAFREHYSGIFVIKPLPGSDYRVIFINELGIKIFDMEFFSSGGFVLHHCIEFLNRKFIINTLRNDISLALNNRQMKVIKVFRGPGNGKSGFKARDGDGIKYILVNDADNRAEKIIRRGGPGKKAVVTFFGSGGTEPDSVKIRHGHIKLNIHFSRIDEKH